jgi:FkbM family methyltransferase
MYINTFLNEIKVTEEVNKILWKNKVLHEASSINYVYRSLLEIIKEKGNARFVDIGANEGLYSLYCKSLDLLRIDSYEPFPLSYKCLVDNIILNGCNNSIFPYNFAISNYKGVGILKCEPSIRTLAQTPDFNEIKVMTDTLDNLYAVRRIDFIRCSVSGSESFIIRGGVNVLKRDKPNLLIRLNETESNIRSKEMFDLLDTLGYKQISIIDDNILFSAK